MILRQRVLLVARVDALGRVADEEVLLPVQARVLLEDRDADLLGGARIDGRLEDDDGAALHVAADRLAGRRPAARSPGWCASSTGVGTATMMKSASASAAPSVVHVSCVAARSSSPKHLAGRIDERRYAATFRSERSKPMVRRRLPNSTASGRPDVAQADDGDDRQATDHVVH